MDIAHERALELRMMLDLRAANLNVSIKLEPSLLMYGMNVVLSIPGQTRTVFLKGTTLELATRDEAQAEQIMDEIKYGAFMLLEKDQDEP